MEEMTLFKIPIYLVISFLAALFPLGLSCWITKSFVGLKQYYTVKLCCLSNNYLTQFNLYP